MKYQVMIDRLRDCVRVRGYSYSTEKTYLHWTLRFMKWLEKNPTEGCRAVKMERFLTALAYEGVSPSTQNQAFNSILFLCRHVFGEDPGNISALRAKRRVHVRVPPPRDVVMSLIDQVPDRSGYPTKLMAQLMYGCGLRVSEPLNLRVKDVSLPNMTLAIRDAKGGKDRLVMLPCRLYRAMEAQLMLARSVAAKDRLDGLPISLPDLLPKKYPKAPFSEGWAFVFPSKSPMRHPRSGVMMRWHCPDREIQRAVAQAAEKVGLSSVFTPHYFRHAYATHTLNAGSNVRDVQEVMGHKSLETTQGYAHPEIRRVRSPMDELLVITR